MSFNLLYFDSVVLSANQMTPHFHCPVCGKDQSLRTWFSIPVAVPPNAILNSNKLTTFTIPNHYDKAVANATDFCSGSGQQIQLYVAQHRDLTHSLATCISVEPIPVDWWKIEDVVPP